jgi:hypothetical protein
VAFFTSFSLLVERISPVIVMALGSLYRAREMDVAFFTSFSLLIERISPVIVMALGSLCVENECIFYNVVSCFWSAQLFN